MADLSARQHMIDWLVKAAAISKLNQSNASLHIKSSQCNDPDYDNLHDIELKSADQSKNKRPLSTIVQYDSETSCIDDDDYAETTIDRTDGSTSASSPDTTNTLIGLSQTKTEFMLKVVIDNANLIGSDGKQDTFYINPSVCF